MVTLLIIIIAALMVSLFLMFCVAVSVTSDLSRDKAALIDSLEMVAWEREDEFFRANEAVAELEKFTKAESQRITERITAPITP